MSILILTQEKYNDYIYQVTNEFAKDHLIFVIYIKSDFEKFVSKFSYDVGVSFMYTYKVPADEVNTHPWINFHPGPLPEYKGRNLCYHAIMNREKYFGATIHYMDENFDTGSIIDVLYFSIDDSDTSGDVHRKTIVASKKLFERYFMAIIKGVPLNSSPNVGGTYYQKMPINNEIYLDDDTKRQIRAITCYPYVPYVVISGEQYKIVRCE